MANEQLTPGARVYSQHGHEAEFVAAVGGEYVVRPIYEDEDGEQCGDVETWSKVFRTPPAPKLDAMTAEAEKRLAELQLEVGELEGQKYALERGEKDRLERIKRHEELSDLDRYLAGEITHYVSVHDYYPTVEIIPIGETMENYASASKYGLLELYPSSHWDKTVRWSVSYRTKRGSDYRTIKVVPCCGEEEAQVRAREVVQEIVDEYLGKERRFRSYTEQLFKVCERFGVPVPQELIEGHVAERRRAAEQRLAKHREELEQAVAELAALSAETSP